MDTESILLLIACIAIPIGIMLFYKAEDRFLGCTKCGRNEALELTLEIDEYSNYELPKAPPGYSSFLRRYRCRNCGYECEIIGQESNGD